MKRRIKKINIYTEPVTTYLTKQQKAELKLFCKMNRKSMSELLRLSIINSLLSKMKEEDSI